ncbi:MAG: dienelactone hydrolase family protein [Burkholderiales bacterium]
MPAANLLRALLTSCLALTALSALANDQSVLRHGSVETPIEVAKPAGKAPWPPVLYIHAKRGFEDVDRTHMKALAAAGFLVLAPDWLSGNLIERWPDRHYPETEDAVEAALDALLKRADACKGPVGMVGKSRGPYFALRLAAKRPRDVAAIVSWYGHFQNPNAAEPQQLFSVAPEVQKIRAPVLFLIGDADFELRRIVGGRAFYLLWERGVTTDMQMYPMARRAFDFRPDQTPEEKIATKHAMAREAAWLRQHVRCAKR